VIPALVISSGMPGGAKKYQRAWALRIIWHGWVLF
jgi:hypothetical protein